MGAVDKQLKKSILSFLWVFFSLICRNITLVGDIHHHAPGGEKGGFVM